VSIAYMCRWLGSMPMVSAKQLVRQLAHSGIGLLATVVSSQCLALVNVVDDRGDPVSLASPATRVISLAPNLTELLFHIGAGDRVVGVMEYSDFPPAAKTLPRVGAHNHFDIETILALRPDLIVGWDSGNPQSDLIQLDELGLPVFVSEAQDVEGVSSLMRRLGTLTGQQDQANQQADAFAREVARLQALYSGRRRLRVFYQVWDQPIYTLNREHIINDLIDACGGENIFADLERLAPVVSLESVIARDPEVIVGGRDTSATPPWMVRWQRWSGITAVRNAHVYAIDANHIGRMGPRLVDGMEALCGVIDKARRAS